MNNKISLILRSDGVYSLYSHSYDERRHGKFSVIMCENIVSLIFGLYLLMFDAWAFVSSKPVRYTQCCPVKVRSSMPVQVSKPNAMCAWINSSITDETRTYAKGHVSLNV